MRTYNKFELPTEIIWKGEKLIIDFEATKLFNETKSPGLLKFEMEQRNKTYAKVQVLSKKLRQRTDLTIKPHQPSVFIFTNHKTISK
jgi:hypothetical protein